MIPQMTNCFSAGRRAPKGSPVSGVRRAHVVQRAIQAVLGLSGPAVWPGCPEPAVRLVNKVLWENRVYRVKPAHRVLRESAAAPVLWGSRDQWDQPALPEKSAPPAPKG